jgi:hypothetical protein
MKIVAAGFATSVTGLTLRQDAYADIQWDLFCDPGVCRYDLSKPWTWSGLTIASDARILVCRDGGDGEVNTERRVPKVDGLWWDEFESSGWGRLADAKRASNPPGSLNWPCEACFGNGYRGVGSPCTNKDCFDGRVLDGDVDPDTIMWNPESYMKDCPTCRGTEKVGVSYCGQCNATGISQESYHYDIQGQAFCPSMIGRLRTLGDIDVRVVDTSDGDKTKVMVFRRGDGVRGFAMGVHL